MATTFTSDDVASTVQARSGTGVIAVVGEYELTAALALNDIIQMVKIPQGATILDIILATDDLESHSTPTITLDVGDGDNDDRFITASTVAQAGGTVHIDEVDGIGYKYTAADTIDIHVDTAPSTGTTTGTLRLVVVYHCFGFN